MAVRIDLTLDCADATRLAAAGATVLQPFPGHHVVMADPDGNEFCVC